MIAHLPYIPTTLSQVQQRQPVFDQLIVNRYQPGEGIQPHVDLLRFEDGVAVMSLGGPAIMTFTHVADEQQQHQVRQVACMVIMGMCTLCP